MRERVTDDGADTAGSSGGAGVPGEAGVRVRSGPDVKLWLGAIGTGVMLVAGCVIGGRLVLGAREATEPVSAQDYASVLAGVDASLKAPFAAVGRNAGARSAEVQGGEAYRDGADELRSAADRLDETVPPEAVGGLQDKLTGALRTLADEVETAGTDTPACPAADPRTTILQSGEARGVRQQAARIKDVDPAYVFGAFLPGAPAEKNRRLRSGAFVVRPSGDGPGELRVRSGEGAGDTAVSLVADGTRKTVFTVYVRAGATHTVEDVPAGTYRIFVASGRDWDSARDGFTRDCAFSRFDDDFRFSRSGTRWTITLSQREGGNASTRGVDPRDFPR